MSAIGKSGFKARTSRRISAPIDAVSPRAQMATYAAHHGSCANGTYISGCEGRPRPFLLTSATTPTISRGTLCVNPKISRRPTAPSPGKNRFANADETTQTFGASAASLSLSRRPWSSDTRSTRN
jgi:hypothetical protein